jgi:hypothetical protein
MGDIEMQNIGRHERDQNEKSGEHNLEQQCQTSGPSEANVRLAGSIMTCKNANL